MQNNEGYHRDFTNYQEISPYYRKPGFDAGTILWPILAIVFFFGTMFLAQAAGLAYAIFTDPVLRGSLGNTDPLDLMTNLTNIQVQQFSVVAIIYSIIQIIALFFFLRSREKREKRYVLKEKNEGKSYLSTVVITFGSIGIAMGWMIIAPLLAQISSFWAEQIEIYEQISSITSNENIFLTLISVCFLVPIAEELVFRGLVLSEFRRVMPDWVGVIVTAVIFGIAHMNPIQSVYAAVCGIMFGLVYIWTESIYQSIFMHIIFNFLGSGLNQILLEFGLEEVSQYLVFFYMIMIIPTIYLLVKLQNKSRGKNTNPIAVVRPEFEEAEAHAEIKA